MLKARVTFNQEKWKWEVWESAPGKPPQHHSFHKTQTGALATAREQNRINMREAGIPALRR